MPVAGYVGYTVPQMPVFRTCVANYNNPNHAPSQQSVVNYAQRYVQQGKPGFNGGFSLFEFTLRLNNRNGAAPIPQGNVIIAKIETSARRVSPCNEPRAPRQRMYFEKFFLKNGVVDDIQIDITACSSTYCLERKCSYAIMADPNPQLANPNNEWALSLPLTQQQNQTFDNSVSLVVEFTYTYDNCNTPPQTPNQRKHHLRFQAKTLDPDRQGQQTWNSGVLEYGGD